MVLASTPRDPGAFEVLKTGKPCTAAPENVDFFRPEGAATGVVVSADTAMAAMAVSNATHTLTRSIEAKTTMTTNKNSFYGERCSPRFL